MRGGLDKVRIVFAATAIALTILFCSSPTIAEDVAVPVDLQAELMAKIASYDKNFAARAGDQAHVLIVSRRGDADSERTAVHMTRALSGLGDIGGLSHDETTVPFTNAKALADLCKARRISIVYVTQALGGEIEAIRDSLTGISVLSVAAVPGYVPRGIVLGFDVVSGRPKLVVHLGQAKKQSVALKAEVLKLVRVIE
jgi:hypothetical protein